MLLVRATIRELPEYLCTLKAPKFNSMWSDNETDRDFLNFTGVADTVAEIIVQSRDRPVSIGVSGAWGVGKSSMIKLIRRALQERKAGDGAPEFVFVEFNAWLYQGYDDARAALMDVIATKLEEEAKERKKGSEKVKELLKRVDWLRAAKLVAGSGAALALGLPPPGLIGEVIRLREKIASGTTDQETAEGIDAGLTNLANTATSLLKPKEDSSPHKEIHAIRENFEEALSEMKIQLVVLIDDLDRCLPTTTIATLEAIRLFLFLKNTAFVIAADDKMIRHAVKQHFGGDVDEHLVTNYFDKLIQVPVRVPPLGTQEVRAYMMLLFVENSSLEAKDKEVIRTKVLEQLTRTWRGNRVDRAFMESVHRGLPSELVVQFDRADRLAPLMTTASAISGNPRLIKRFLNTLAIRMAISRTHGVDVDEAALAKMLLFERCGDPRAHAALLKAVTEDEAGKPRFLAEWEDRANKGDELELEPPWHDPFVREWLTLPPRLSDLDLRGVLYVSREHAPLISPEDRLSSEAAELLGAMLEHPEMAMEIRDQLESLQQPEIAIITGRVLERARQEQKWGTPAVLDACLVLAEVDSSQGSRIAAFLRDRPVTQLEPSIVPKIADKAWAGNVLQEWEKLDVSPALKKAIAQRKRK